MSALSYMSYKRVNEFQFYIATGRLAAHCLTVNSCVKAMRFLVKLVAIVGIRKALNGAR